MYVNNNFHSTNTNTAITKTPTTTTATTTTAPIVGVENRGNTCFIATVLQALFVLKLTPNPLAPTLSLLGTGTMLLTNRKKKHLYT